MFYAVIIICIFNLFFIAKKNIFQCLDAQSYEVKFKVSINFKKIQTL